MIQRCLQCFLIHTAFCKFPQFAFDERDKFFRLRCLRILRYNREKRLPHIHFKDTADIRTDSGIQKGLPANITILDIDQGEHEFIDAFGLRYSGPVQFTPRATIFRGEIKYSTIVSDY